MLSCDWGSSNLWNNRPLRGLPVADLVKLSPQVTVWAEDLEHGSATAFRYAEAAARLPVAECDLVGKHDHVAVPENGAARLVESPPAAASPGYRVFVIGWGQQVEDRCGAVRLAGAHVFGQSGRIGAAQRVSPDPPAEPHVQLSLHAALRCDNTILIPAIGQASPVSVGVTQIA